MKYTILEFKDGLQLVPSKWLINGEGKCYFPSFISQLRIDKAIEGEEDPGKEWKMCSVQRIFGTAATYKQGVKKLSLAMRFLEIDNEVECTDETKKSRRQSVNKRHIDELEDDGLSPKRVLSPLQVIRHLPQDQNIQVLYAPPPFTQPFYTSSVPHHSNIRSEIDVNSSYLSASPSQRERNNNEVSESIQKMLENVQKEISQKLDKINEKLQSVDKLEGKLQIVDKLQEKLQIVEKLEERLQIIDKFEGKLQIVDKFEEKLQNVDKISERLEILDQTNEKLQNIDKLDGSLQTIDAINEKLQNVEKMDGKLDAVIEGIKKYEARYKMSDIPETVGKNLHESDVKRMVAEFFSDVEENMFPFNSVERFEEFEKKLQNPSYFVQMVNIFKEVEGKDVYSFVTGVMKKIMTNWVAEQYSWLGRKGKRVFKPFVLNKVIVEAVRVREFSAPDSDVYDIISKWLVRAKSREAKKDFARCPLSLKSGKVREMKKGLGKSGKTAFSWKKSVKNCHKSGKNENKDDAYKTE